MYVCIYAYTYICVCVIKFHNYKSFKIKFNAHRSINIISIKIFI